MATTLETTRTDQATIPFRTKLTAVGALLAILPLSAVGFALLQIGTETVQTMSQEYQVSVADDLARTIESELRDAQNGLDAVGRVLTDTALGQDAAIALALNLVASNESLDHVGLYTAEGKLVDIVREGGARRINPPEQLSDATIVNAASENVATEAPIAGATSPRVPLFVPMRAGGRLSGFAGAMVSLDRVQSRVERLTEVRFEGLPDALYVIDGSMRVLAHSDVQVARSMPTMKGQGALEGVDPNAVSERLQKSSEYDHNGVPMVGTIIGLRAFPWAVVAQVPQSVAYASLHTMRRIIVVTTFIAIVLALAVSFGVARQITRPIAELSQFARDLAGRKFDRRVTVNTRDELAVLGDVMSSAAADLQASEERIREEEAIRGDLGRYLPAELVEQVVRREQDMGLGGERREITVLFADVVAFTPMSDTMSAEKIVGLLNELFTILTEIVFRHGGTVDKFIGDCVMAIWGAPRAQDDHAASALHAAEDMIRWLEAGNKGWAKTHGVTIELAIGINSGDAVVGNIGSETRMQYTAIGDVVNVAARLETIARPQQILITEATRDAAGESFETRALGSRQLTGRSEPVELFEVRV